VGTSALGLLVTVVVVRSVPPEVPHPTEAYEGFGDAVMAPFHMFVGVVVSILIALFTAILVAVRVSATVEAKQREQGASADRGH
jgi:hypothetical protein